MIKESYLGCITNVPKHFSCEMINIYIDEKYMIHHTIPNYLLIVGSSSMFIKTFSWPIDI